MDACHSASVPCCGLWLLRQYSVPQRRETYVCINTSVVSHVCLWVYQKSLAKTSRPRCPPQATIPHHLKPYLPYRTTYHALLFAQLPWYLALPSCPCLVKLEPLWAGTGVCRQSTLMCLRATVPRRLRPLTLTTEQRGVRTWCPASGPIWNLLKPTTDHHRREARR